MTSCARPRRSRRRWNRTPPPGRTAATPRPRPATRWRRRRCCATRARRSRCPPAHEPIAAAHVAPALDARRSRGRRRARLWIATSLVAPAARRRLAAVRDDAQPAGRVPGREPAAGADGGPAGRPGGGHARRRPGERRPRGARFEDARLPAPVSRGPAPPRRRRAMIGRCFARVAAALSLAGLLALGCSRRTADGCQSLGRGGRAPARARRPAPGGGRSDRPRATPCAASWTPASPPIFRPTIAGASSRTPTSGWPGSTSTRAIRAPPSPMPTAASRSAAPRDLFVANLLVVRGAAHEALGEGPAAAEDYHEALVINDRLLAETLRGPADAPRAPGERAVTRLLAAVLLAGRRARPRARHRASPAAGVPARRGAGGRRAPTMSSAAWTPSFAAPTRRRRRPTAPGSVSSATTSARSPPASARSRSGSRPDRPRPSAAPTARRAAGTRSKAHKRAAARRSSCTGAYAAIASSGLALRLSRDRRVDAGVRSRLPPVPARERR